jgi:hypothetical protein
MVFALAFPAARSVCAQRPDSTVRDTTARDTTLEDGISAGEAEAEPRRRRLIHWNEFEGPVMTLRVGAGLLVDYAGYEQDAASKDQMTLESGWKLRDSRFVITGRFKTKRRITYQAGIMYDGYIDEWFIRQTGVMFAVPELWGHLWLGARRKDPASTG